MISMSEALISVDSESKSESVWERLRCICQQAERQRPKSGNGLFLDVSPKFNGGDVLLGWIASIHWYVEEVATCSPCGNLRTTKGQHMGKYIADSCLLPVAPWYIYCTSLYFINFVPILKIPFSKNHLCERVMWDQIIRRGLKNNPHPPGILPQKLRLDQ